MAWLSKDEPHGLLYMFSFGDKVKVPHHADT